jgi:hypothetical protein
VDERVEISQVDARERAADREALPFEPLRGRTVVSSTTTAGIGFDSLCPSIVAGM